MFFYSGNFPPEASIFHAITWHNAHYLSRKGSDSEVKAFSEMLFGAITATSSTDPVSAYESAGILASVRKAPHAEKAKNMQKKLKQASDVKRYLAGLKDVEGFVDDHMTGGCGEYVRMKWAAGRPGMDAKKAEDKYSGSPFQKIFRGLANPCGAQTNHQKNKK